jgi:hypothetical protein
LIGDKGERREAKKRSEEETGELSDDEDERTGKREERM